MDSPDENFPVQSADPSPDHLPILAGRWWMALSSARRPMDFGATFHIVHDGNKMRVELPLCGKPGFECQPNADALITLLSNLSSSVVMQIGRTGKDGIRLPPYHPYGLDTPDIKDVVDAIIFAANVNVRRPCNAPVLRRRQFRSEAEARAIITAFGRGSYPANLTRLRDIYYGFTNSLDYRQSIAEAVEVQHLLQDCFCEIFGWSN